MWDVEAEIEKQVKKHGEKRRALIMDSLYLIHRLEQDNGRSYKRDQYVLEMIQLRNHAHAGVAQ